MMGSSVLSRLMSFSYRVGMKFSWLIIFSTYLTSQVCNQRIQVKLTFKFLPNLSSLLVVDVQEAPNDVEVRLV